MYALVPKHNHLGCRFKLNVCMYVVGTFSMEFHSLCFGGIRFFAAVVVVFLCIYIVASLLCTIRWRAFVCAFHFVSLNSPLTNFSSSTSSHTYTHILKLLFIRWNISFVRLSSVFFFFHCLFRLFHQHESILFTIANFHFANVFLFGNFFFANFHAGKKFVVNDANTIPFLLDLPNNCLAINS